MISYCILSRLLWGVETPRADEFHLWKVIGLKNTYELWFYIICYHYCSGALRPCAVKLSLRNTIGCKKTHINYETFWVREVLSAWSFEFVNIRAWCFEFVKFRAWSFVREVCEVSCVKFFMREVSSVWRFECVKFWVREVSSLWSFVREVLSLWSFVREVSCVKFWVHEVLCAW
jgi:hypothetical protein